MSVQVAEIIVAILITYGILGVLFAIPFLVFGIGRLDLRAKGAGLAFRLIVFPGVVALWPLLLRRSWRRGTVE